MRRLWLTHRTHRKRHAAAAHNTCGVDGVYSVHNNIIYSRVYYAGARASRIREKFRRPHPAAARILRRYIRRTTRGQGTKVNIPRYANAQTSGATRLIHRRSNAENISFYKSITDRKD